MLEDRQHNALAALELLGNVVRNDGGEPTISRSKYAANIANGTWQVVWEPDSFGRATIMHANTGRNQTIRVDDRERNDAAERQVTEAEARTLNSARTGAAWSTGEGEYKKWWTHAASRNDGLSEDVAAWQRRYEEAKPEPRNDDATTEVIQIAGKSYTIKQTGPKEWRYEAGINSMNGASLSSDMARQQLIRAMQQRYG